MDTMFTTRISRQNMHYQLNNNNMQYLTEYGEFMDSYKLKEISAEEIGEKIARFAQYFAQHNLELVQAEFARTAVAATTEARVDDNGKQISSTKAGVITDATKEAHEYRKARAHVQNIEQMINALKSLQKGSLNEYSHQI